MNTRCEATRKYGSLAHRRGVREATGAQCGRSSEPGAREWHRVTVAPGRMIMRWPVCIASLTLDP